MNEVKRFYSKQDFIFRFHTPSRASTPIDAFSRGTAVERHFMEQARPPSKPIPEASPGRSAISGSPSIRSLRAQFRLDG